MFEFRNASTSTISYVPANCNPGPRGVSRLPLDIGTAAEGDQICCSQELHGCPWYAQRREAAARRLQGGRYVRDTHWTLGIVVTLGGLNRFPLVD